MTLYLYALVDAPPREPIGHGIARRPLSVVRVGKVYVVVEAAEAREATTATVVAHDRIVRRIARPSSSVGPAVLPLRFASTVKDRVALEALLAPMSGAIARAFDRVRGAVQFTLRVTGQAAPAPELPRSLGPGTRWLAERVRAQRVPEIDVLSRVTSELVREARAQRHDRPPLLANVYHLVARENVRRWRAAVSRSLRELDHVRVTTTGPWPPYAFAELA